MMPGKNDPRSAVPLREAAPAADALLVEGLRAGDAEAGHLFFRNHYPGVYRYLLYLTGRRELAEDLAQETFIQAWRRLETFDNRGPLRPWLHRIAHREFLQVLRSRHAESSLEEAGENALRDPYDPTDAIELRAVLAKLPLHDREVLALHYVEGLTCGEIARIVGATVSTVKYRLAAGRDGLRRELGEGDLVYLNQSPAASFRRWAWLPLETLSFLEARLLQTDRSAERVLGASTDRQAAAAAVPSTLNRQPSTNEKERNMSDTTGAGMSRRKLLEAAGTAAAAAAAGLAGHADAAALQKESEVNDDRLNRKVTLAVKATALADLCEHLRGQGRVHLTAGPSVADEKVTLFCPETPLRVVMRQLSRPFGYTWLRSGKPGEYRYELVQDLRSQLMEEELRNRDRNAALLVLEREIERYRPYLDLSPDEALARSRTTPPEEKALLERFAGPGWGIIQIYFRLTPQQMAELRAGQSLTFSQEPKADELPLPADMARGVLQSQREARIYKLPDGFGAASSVTDPSDDGLRPTAMPEARAKLTLRLHQSEVGQFALAGHAGVFTHSSLPRNSGATTADLTLAIGTSPTVVRPDNRAANARLARDPELRTSITVDPAPSCQSSVSSSVAATEAASSSIEHPASALGKQATSADVLGALHQATRRPIVADYYTRLYEPGMVSVRNQALFEALSQLADAMRMRWNKDEDWLEFRSTGFYDDRLKEVPNRLLSRWAASRQQHGALSLDELVEIAQLTDAQLDAADMAEGAEECLGLTEWRLPRLHHLRPHLRFLAEFTPAQRQEATSPQGLAFSKMPLSQQQRFIADVMKFSSEPLRSLEELEGAALRVEYTQPGWFEWRPAGANWFRYVTPLEGGPEGRRALRPPVRERTSEAALAAARRLDPHLLQGMGREAQRLDPKFDARQMAPQLSQMVATELDLTFVYFSGTSNRRSIHVVQTGADHYLSTW